MLLAVIGLLAIVVALVALTTSSSSGGTLDPRSAAPDGSRALATLLRARGIAVDRGSAVGPGRTVLVPFPSDLDEAQLGDLLRSGADVILNDPGPVSVAQVGVDGSSSRQLLAPGCDFAAARTAGAARVGGTRYTSGNVATSCYGGTLLVLAPGSVPGGGRLIVLGSFDFLTNARLDQQGNAALAIGILSANPRLTWYTARRATSGATLSDLLPDAVGWAALQLGFAVVLVAFWRGRRLGPVVTEPLPVVVRAAETVLGRARLYAAARARGIAAESLRSATRARLGTLLHLDAAASPQALISAVAERAGSDPVAVAAVLYAGAGDPGPQADSALVRLADDLDQLEKEVSRR